MPEISPDSPEDKKADSPMGGRLEGRYDYMRILHMIVLAVQLSGPLRDVTDWRTDTTASSIMWHGMGRMYLIYNGSK